ncbi:hypothetical protein OC835_003068 [Tilletia horrida]|nr:hypothetical protein OC835_003068 [Tilletia horrida]
MPESTITFTEIIETELRGQAAEAFDARLDIGRVGHVGANAMRALEKGTFSIMENARISDAHLLMASAPPAAWQNFLVPLYPKGSELFGEADSAVATVKRPTLNGITFFDQKRKSCVQVYDLQRFMQRFDTYTSSVLAHINWANVLVAGGAVLASLTSDIGAVDAFAGNDIDLYLYGLSEEEADAKLLQIREGIDYAVKGFDRVYKTTLSSGVVTFEPRAHGSSLRSIQIVLRMHINPAHILASFDLDQCAVGFSGNQVWLEPRAVRAIKLGVSYITTQLMHGTSIRRLFK